MRGSSRLAVCFCLLVLLNDLGTAHFMRLSSHNPSFDAYIKGNKTTVSNEASKRGAGTTLLKYGFKVLKLGSEVLPKVSTLTFVLSTIYGLITQCCKGPYGDACKWNKESEKIKEEIETKGHEIDLIQLETKNLQDLLFSINDNFDNIADEIADIGEESQALLNSLNPNLTGVLSETTTRLTKLISDKSKVDEEVDYVEIVGDYFERIDGLINIAVPTIAVALPMLPNSVGFGKKRLARRKSIRLKKRFDGKVRFNVPTGSTPEAKGFKSWFSKGKQWVKSKVAGIKKKMNTKYQGALEKVDQFAEIFGILYGYVDAALTIYGAIENFKKCENAYDEAKAAVTEMRKAKTTLYDIYDAAIAARNIMFQARDDLQDAITSDAFLNDLGDLKRNMESIQDGGNGLQDMIDGVDAYIMDIKSTNNFEVVASLISRLYSSLGGFPFVYRCLVTKTAFLSFAIKECKRGTTIETIIQDSSTMYDVNSTSCQEKLSTGYLTPAIIQQVIDKAAERQGFNKDCRMNDVNKIERICLIHCEGKGKSASQIAEKVSWPEDKVHVVKIIEYIRSAPKELMQMTKKNCFTGKNAKIELVLPSCPSCLEVKKDLICMMRDFNASDSDIRKKLPMLTLQEIDSVDCNKKK